MQCANHSDRPAITVCNRCGKNICSECLVDVKGESYCKACLVEKTEQIKKEERSPGLAAFLSFFVAGLGQIYNGQIGKGILIFFTAWLIIPWIIGIVDAYRIAVKINKGELVIKSRPGCLIAAAVGMVIFIVGFFILVLLAAIAIPNLLRARIAANEASTKANIQTLSVAIETYKATKNGSYPEDESLLVNAQPPFISQAFNHRTLHGYIFTETFRPDGYQIIARPQVCNSTGTKIFTLVSGSDLSVTDCRPKGQ